MSLKEQRVRGSGAGTFMATADTSNLLFVRTGWIELLLEGHPPLTLAPHHLVIVPASCAFQVSQSMSGKPQADGEAVILVGSFKATFQASTDLFEPLSPPVVEQFSSDDSPEATLLLAMEELEASGMGCNSLAADAVKQVLVKLVRRSFASLNGWTRRFAGLMDPQIAAVLDAIRTSPFSAHDSAGLAKQVGLEQGAFTKEFLRLVGHTPAHEVRRARMQTAALRIRSTDASLQEVAALAGYRTVSGFARAFKVTCSLSPSQYRKAFSRTLAPKR